MANQKLQEIIELTIREIQPNPLQPRGSILPDSLNELVDSIKEHGVLEPLVVAHTPAGYQIVAGERRWRAARMAGLIKVPVIIKETSPQGMLEMALVENVQREDLNPLERAKAFERLIAEFGLTKSDIGKRIGKSLSYVTNTMGLLKLPDALKDALLSGLITEGHARALLSIKDVPLMIEAYKMLLRESGSVRRAEEISRRVKAKIQKRVLKGSEVHIIQDETDNIQKKLGQKLGEKASVKIVRTTKSTKVLILLFGSPEETEENFQKIAKGITSS